MPEDEIDEHIANRDIDLIEDDGESIVTIETLHKQRMSPSNFMNTFNSFTNDYRRNANQYSNIQGRIEQIDEEAGSALKALHNIDSDQEQRGEVKPNSVTTDDIKRYNQLQQLQEKKEQIYENQEDIQSSIEDMWPMARRLHESDEFDVELPKNTTLLEFLDIDEELRKDIMNVEGDEDGE